MERLSPLPVELCSVRDILRGYCQALTGTDVQILSTAELSRRSIGWTSIEQAATEGNTVLLPPTAPDADSAADSFTAYKVLATHPAGHLEFARPMPGFPEVDVRRRRYEVLDDIYVLPRRLPNLYRRLTTGI